MNQSKMFKRYRLSHSIIQAAARLHHRFNLSQGDVEDLMAQRGITDSYEAIRL
jgi:putative transposase